MGVGIRKSLKRLMQSDNEEKVEVPIYVLCTFFSFGQFIIFLMICDVPGHQWKVKKLLGVSQARVTV